MHIKVISGRNGDFRVGRLVTDIGEFAVKDAELDQYEEGRYEGEFGISQISPSYYSTGGRLVVEVRARLGMIDLASVDDPEPASSSLEQDPLDEQAATVAPQEVAEAAKDDGIETLGTGTDAELFGLLWPLASPLKLDPTVDRNDFRKQRDRLKALGYTFEAIGQQWIKD